MKVKIVLQPTINQPVCLGVRPLSETEDQIFATVRQVRVSLFGVPCLTRGWVCSLQLLLVLASSFIPMSESRRTHDHILLSQIRDSPNLEDQVPVFISPRKRAVRLYHKTLGSFYVTSYGSQGYGGGIQTRLHEGITG
jgi:hypothetical protein